MRTHRFQVRRGALALAVICLLALGVALPAAALAGAATTISGMRTMPDGSSDSHASVQIYRQSPSGWSYVSTLTVTSSLDGTYETGALSDGTYRVGENLLIVGATAYSPAFYGGGVTLATGSNVVISGSSAENIDLHRTSDVVTTDTAEPDNTPRQARTLAPGGDWVERTLCGEPDSDWIKFDAVAGHTYAIETSGSPTHPLWSSDDYGLTDTYVYLFGSDGRSELAYNDDSSGDTVYSYMSWTATSSGPLYMRVTSYDQVWGTTAFGAYRLRVADVPSEGTATLEGSVVDTSSGSVGIARAHVSIGIVGDYYSRRNVVTRPDGSFSLTGLPAGDYEFEVRAVGYDSTSTADTVSLASGATVRQDFQMQMPASPTSGKLVGSVQFADGGAAIEATVTLDGPGGTQTATPDGSGCFEFSALQPGVYSVRIASAGYRTIVEDHVVGAGNSSIGETVLIEVLSPVGAVKGTVSSGGAGLGGVTVATGDLTTTTASDGSYELPLVDVGTAQLTFSKATYTPVVLSVDVTKDVTSTLDATLVEALAPVGTVKGTVRHAGAGLGGVTVATGGLNTTTASDGTYVLSGVGIGTAQLTFSKATYTPVVLSVDVTKDVTSTLDATLVEALAPVGTVKGTVRSGGVGLGGVTVATGDLTTTTAADGTYVLSGVGIGTAQLTFSKATYTSVGLSVSVSKNATSVLDATMVEVLSPAGTVRGIVRHAGVGLGGVTVAAGGMTTTTAANGTYVLSGVGIGTARLAFSKATYTSVGLSVSVTKDATSVLDATLVHPKTACSITRSPKKSTLKYKRKKGSVKFTLKATLSGVYGRFSASRVYLQYSSNGKKGWKTLAKLTTNASGVASRSIKVKKKSTRYYRWYAPNSSAHTARYTAKQKVVVK